MSSLVDRPICEFDPLIALSWCSIRQFELKFHAGGCPLWGACLVVVRGEIPERRARFSSTPAPCMLSFSLALRHYHHDAGRGTPRPFIRINEFAGGCPSLRARCIWLAAGKILSISTTWKGAATKELATSKLSSFDHPNLKLSTAFRAEPFGILT